MDFTAAKEYLKKRLQMPTDMASRVISEEIPAQVRAHCFFSARVAEGNVLDRLRGISDAYGNGEIDLATARMKFKKWYDQKKPGQRFEDGEGITNISSTMRLDLVMRQNAAMAAGVGRYQVSRDPEIEERWPCWRYITGPNPRDAHAALDGKVFLKSDPVWHRIYPPWEFNCNCDVEDAELPEKGADKIAANAVPESESGFRFDPAEAFKQFDPDLILDPELREQTVSEMVGKYGDQKWFGWSGKDNEISRQEQKIVKTVEKSMRDLADTVKLDGLNAQQAREVNETLQSISRQYRLDKLGMVATEPGDGPLKPASTRRDTKTGKIIISIKLTGVANLDQWRTYPPEHRQDVLDGKTGGNPAGERRKFHVRHNVGAKSDAGYSMAHVMRHEAAHAILKQMDPDRRHELYELAEQLKNEYIENADRKISLHLKHKGIDKREWPEEDRKELKKFDITMLSEYAEASPAEFVAESFLAQQIKQQLPKPLTRLIEKLPTAKKKG